MNGFLRITRTVAPPIMLAVVFCAIWHLGVTLFDVKPFLLPSPLRVGEAFVTHRSVFATAARFTALAALGGLAASTIVGIFVGILFAQSSFVRRSGYPYAIYLQTAPIVAIAPLLVNWIGEGFTTIVVVVFIISLFPIVTNTTDGLLAVPQDLRELFRLNKATRWQTLWLLQLPYALPRILTGVKISSAMVILGATVGEYFVGSFSTDDTGLGHAIFKANSLFQTDRLFAATILCTVLSVIIFSSVSAVGRLLVRWAEEQTT